MSTTFQKGVLSISGVRIMGDAAFALLRAAVPSLGRYERIDLDTGAAQEAGLTDGKKPDPVQIDLPVGLVDDLKALPEVAEQMKAAHEALVRSLVQGHVEKYAPKHARTALSEASALGLLTDEQKAASVDAQAWIKSLEAARDEAIAYGTLPELAAPPQAVIDLREAFKGAL